MSNKYHNFHMPEFQTKYGSDWDGWLDEIEDLYDYIFQNIFDLYRLSQLNRMSNRVVKINLDVMDVRYESTDTNQQKKEKLRLYPYTSFNKGLRQPYNDLIKTITSTDSNFYNETEMLRRWEVGRWEVMRWPENGNQFAIYIDVLTSDNTKLDSIVDLLNDKEMNPMFYVIYLIDSTGTNTVLRTIN